MKNSVLKFSVVIMFMITTVSCGYSIRGISKDGVKPSFYVENTWNKSPSAILTPLIQTIIEDYLIDYNELARESYAKYTLSPIVNSIDYSPLITSQYDESTATNTKIEITFIVSDRAGVEIYSGTFSAVKSYPVAGAAAEIIRGREISVAEAIDSIMADFRNSFYKIDR